jgi:repressor LexA
MRLYNKYLSISHSGSNKMAVGRKNKNQLTDRQKEILDYIKRVIKRDNMPPTIKDICSEFGFASTNGVHQVLTVLEKKGYIKRIAKGASRGIKIIKKAGRKTTEEVAINQTEGLKIFNTPKEFTETALAVDKAFFGISEEAVALFVIDKSMLLKGLNPGDVVIADKAITPENGKLVAVKIGERYIIREYVSNLFGFELHPAGKGFSVINGDLERDLQILGVIVGKLSKI